LGLIWKNILNLDIFISIALVILEKLIENFLFFDLGGEGSGSKNSLCFWSFVIILSIIIIV